MNRLLITFWDLLHYARILKTHGVDKHHRYCVLKGFISCADLANKYYSYHLDYYDGIGLDNATKVL